jgi:hypothetical protein
MCGYVVVSTVAECFSLQHIENDTEFHAVLDTSHLLSDIALHMPNLQRQLAYDLIRSRVVVDGVGVDTPAALHGRIRPALRTDIGMLCTQACIGCVIVPLQRAVAPLIIAECDDRMPWRPRHLSVCVHTALDRAAILIKKHMRIVHVDDDTGVISTVCGIHIQIDIATDQGESVLSVVQVS